MIDPRQSVYVGHLGPAPLYVHWSALILLYMSWRWSGGSTNPTEVVAIAMLLIVSIVLHELGHGLMSRALGRTEAERSLMIVLWAFGGVCYSQGDSKPWKRLLVVLAGPAVSAVLAGLGWFGFDLFCHLWPEHVNGTYQIGRQALSLPAYLLLMGFVMNLGLLIFNMIPIYPLDGGQALYNTMKLLFRDFQLARTISFSLSIILMSAYFIWSTHQQGQIDFYLLVMFGFLLYNAYLSLFIYRH